MAEVRFKILGDLSQLRKDLSDLIKKKYKIDIGGSGKSSSGAKAGAVAGKKATGLLAGILKALGPLAILLSLKPVTDLLKLIFSFAMLGFMQIGTLLSKLWDTIKTVSSDLWETIKGLWKSLTEWFSTLWTTTKEWLSKLWEWIKTLAGLYVEYLKWLWGMMKPILSALWEGIKAVASRVWETIKWLWGLMSPVLQKVWEWIKLGWDILQPILEKVWEKIVELKDKLMEKIPIIVSKLLELKDKIVEKFTEWKTKLEDLRDKLVEKLQPLVDIYNYIKNLASDIAAKIKSLIPSPSSMFRKSDKVDDAIIKPDGSIIRTHPNDTIIATKTPESMGGGSKTFNFYGVTPQQMIDTIKRELATDVNASSRF